MAKQRGTHFVDTVDPTVKTFRELDPADALLGHVAHQDFITAYSVMVRQGDQTFRSVPIGETALLGRPTGGTATIQSIDMPTLRTMLNVVDGATDDQTGAEILTALLAVDGINSGLDADLLDGLEGSAYATAAHTHSEFAPILQAVPLGGVTGDVLTKRNDDPSNFDWAAAGLFLVQDLSPQLGGDLDLSDGQTTWRIVEGANEILRYEGGDVYLGGYRVFPADVTVAELGDIMIYNDSDAEFQDLNVGTDGQTLVADSTATLGVRWGGREVVSSGTAPATPADGDLWFDTGTKITFEWDNANTRWVGPERVCTQFHFTGAIAGNEAFHAWGSVDSGTDAGIVGDIQWLVTRVAITDGAGTNDLAGTLNFYRDGVSQGTATVAMASHVEMIDVTDFQWGRNVTCVMHVDFTHTSGSATDSMLTIYYHPMIDV